MIPFGRMHLVGALCAEEDLDAVTLAHLKDSFTRASEVLIDNRQQQAAHLQWADYDLTAGLDELEEQSIEEEANPTRQGGQCAPNEVPIDRMELQQGMGDGSVEAHLTLNATTTQSSSGDRCEMTEAPLSCERITQKRSRENDDSGPIAGAYSLVKRRRGTLHPSLSVGKRIVAPMQSSREAKESLESPTFRESIEKSPTFIQARTLPPAPPPPVSALIELQGHLAHLSQVGFANNGWQPRKNLSNLYSLARELVDEGSRTRRILVAVNQEKSEILVVDESGTLDLCSGLLRTAQDQRGFSLTRAVDVPAASFPLSVIGDAYRFDLACALMKECEWRHIGDGSLTTLYRPVGDKWLFLELDGVSCGVELDGPEAKVSVTLRARLELRSMTPAKGQVGERVLCLPRMGKAVLIGVTDVPEGSADGPRNSADMREFWRRTHGYRGIDEFNGQYGTVVFNNGGKEFSYPMRFLLGGRPTGHRITSVMVRQEILNVFQRDIFRARDCRCEAEFRPEQPDLALDDEIRLHLQLGRPPSDLEEIKLLIKEPLNDPLEIGTRPKAGAKKYIGRNAVANGRKKRTDGQPIPRTKPESPDRKTTASRVRGKNNQYSTAATSNAKS